MGDNYFLGGPLCESSRNAVQDALKRRFSKVEDRYNHIDHIADRFINKGLGLLTYDGLLIAIGAIGIESTGLPIGALLGIILSVLSSLLIMLFTLRVRWAKKPADWESAEADFEGYVHEVVCRGIAVNVGLYLAMLATMVTLASVVYFRTSLIFSLPSSGSHSIL